MKQTREKLVKPTKHYPPFSILSMVSSFQLVGGIHSTRRERKKRGVALETCPDEALAKYGNNVDKDGQGTISSLKQSKQRCLHCVEK